MQIGPDNFTMSYDQQMKQLLVDESCGKTKLFQINSLANQV